MYIYIYPAIQTKTIKRMVLDGDTSQGMSFTSVGQSIVFGLLGFSCSFLKPVRPVRTARSQGVSNGGPLVVGWGLQPGDPDMKVLVYIYIYISLRIIGPSYGGS